VSSDERMLEILADIDEAREGVRFLRNDFPRALKRWADAEKQIGDHYFKLSEVIIDQNTGAISDSKIASILSATAQVPDTDGAWNSLVRLSQQWDDAIRKLIRACSMYVAYKSYEEAMDQRPTSALSVLRPYDFVREDQA
jgi:hypothetical protein